jgi:hypothetical protein
MISLNVEAKPGFPDPVYNQDPARLPAAPGKVHSGTGKAGYFP